MGSIGRFAATAALLALDRIVAAQLPSDTDEERMDTALRKFGYVNQTSWGY